MNAMLVRAARSEDLEALVDLLREDVIREVDESQEPAASHRAAFEEIRADAHQDLLVGEVADRARERGAARVELTTNARRERAQAFYRSLGFTASHVGRKLCPGASAGAEQVAER